MPSVTISTDTPLQSSDLVRRGHPQPTLTVLQGPRTGSSFALEPRDHPYTIGREGEVDVLIPHETISRNHAAIWVLGSDASPPVARLQDEGSTNGTWVNGDRTTHHVLSPGDKVQLGDVILRFDLFEAQVPTIATRLTDAVRAATLEDALEQMWLAYQPIVSWGRRSVFGFEGLLRSDHPLFSSPLQLIDLARQFGRLVELGRVIRNVSAQAARDLPRGSHMFVNLLPDYLDDDDLFDPMSPLSKVAHHCVLELTERAPLLEVDAIDEKIDALRALGFRIAIDDLGAGYAGLTSVAKLKPDIVKLDMDLVRDAHLHANKRSLVRSVSAACDEMGVQLVAEGIESEEELGAMADLGCDLMQGFLFARPGRMSFEDSSRAIFWPA